MKYIIVHTTRALNGGTAMQQSSVYAYAYFWQREFWIPRSMWASEICGRYAHGATITWHS